MALVAVNSAVSAGAASPELLAQGNMSSKVPMKIGTATALMMTSWGLMSLLAQLTFMRT